MTLEHSSAPSAQSRLSAATIGYLRSVVLLVVTTLTLLALGWFNGVAATRTKVQTDAVAVAHQTRQELADFTALESRYGAPFIAATIASVPDALDLAAFYEWLESEATQHAVTVQYNFTSLAQEEGKRVANQWTVAADFLGTAADLQAFLHRLETGLYHLSISSLTFDTTDPSASQLKLIFVLYGGSHG